MASFDTKQQPQMTRKSKPFKRLNINHKLQSPTKHFQIKYKLETRFSRRDLHPLFLDRRKIDWIQPRSSFHPHIPSRRSIRFGCARDRKPPSSSSNFSGTSSLPAPDQIFHYVSQVWHSDQINIFPSIPTTDVFKSLTTCGALWVWLVHRCRKRSRP